jgi:hypothetical protein
MRRFVLVCSLLMAAVGSCSLPNFSPPKLGDDPATIQPVAIQVRSPGPG